MAGTFRKAQKMLDDRHFVNRLSSHIRPERDFCVSLPCLFLYVC